MASWQRQFRSFYDPFWNISLKFYKMQSSAEVPDRIPEPLRMDQTKYSPSITAMLMGMVSDVAVP